MNDTRAPGPACGPNDLICPAVVAVHDVDVLAQNNCVQANTVHELPRGLQDDVGLEKKLLKRPWQSGRTQPSGGKIPGPISQQPAKPTVRVMSEDGL